MRMKLLSEAETEESSEGAISQSLDYGCSALPSGPKSSPINEALNDGWMVTRQNQDQRNVGSELEVNKSRVW